MKTKAANAATTAKPAIVFFMVLSFPFFGCFHFPEAISRQLILFDKRQIRISVSWRQRLTAAAYFSSKQILWGCRALRLISHLGFSSTNIEAIKFSLPLLEWMMHCGVGGGPRQPLCAIYCFMQLQSLCHESKINTPSPIWLIY
ncbi:hypothetical protein [uncultured Desulfosarcina sp.]|uniref:hypothetical protein n=1 Tax=uncultured Desulfosarcina sp. TaxID=218289 RepID=UPI0029C7C6CC|nr:hypothetical protein [uncultured Desulfosarcina sp.]